MQNGEPSNRIITVIARRSGSRNPPAAAPPPPPPEPEPHRTKILHGANPVRQLYRVIIIISPCLPSFLCEGGEAVFWYKFRIIYIDNNEKKKSITHTMNNNNSINLQTPLAMRYFFSSRSSYTINVWTNNFV